MTELNSEKGVPSSKRSVAHGDVMTNGLSILVAEDELLVQEITRAVLEDHGFNVLCASTTAEALRIVEGNDDLDTVFLDIDIGDKGGGYSVARLVRALYPNTRIIYTSGGSLGEFERERVHGTEFVPKPYSPEHVCAMLEARLAS